MATNGKRSAIGTIAVRRITLSCSLQLSQSSLKSIDFVTQETKARLIYDSDRLEGLVAENEEEVEHIPNLSSKHEPRIQSLTTSETVFICAFAMPIITKARRSLSWRV